MTLFIIIFLVALAWIAHGFWCDYKASKRPLTEEEQKQLFVQIDFMEQELLHKRLYLRELASPWQPKPTINLMFISAATKREYLESTKWQQLRNTRLRIAHHKCESCGSTHQLQCHHITYQRLTNEHIDDLAILCGGSNGCHQRIHNLLGYDRTIEYPISILKDQLC